MYTLHGFPVSNYFNMVKLALLEKGLPFEVVTLHGSQSEECLRISPRGKVPVLGVAGGHINETSAILEYLEESGSGKPLLPADPFERAQVRSLMKEIELYIELPARLGYPQAFFGMPIPEAIRARCEAELLAGIATLKRHGRFTPYVAGDSFTLADIYFLYSIDLACVVGKKLFDRDLLADFPAARALLERLNANPHVQAIAADKDADMPKFLAMVRARASQ